MVKKAVQRGRSERRGDAYSAPYVEPLSDVRTKLAVFFTILLEIRLYQHITPHGLDAQVLERHGIPKATGRSSADEPLGLSPAEKNRRDVTHQPLGEL
jgi:hypothetical protein